MTNWEWEKQTFRDRLEDIFLTMEEVSKDPSDPDIMEMFDLVELFVKDIKERFGV